MPPVVPSCGLTQPSVSHERCRLHPLEFRASPARWLDPDRAAGRHRDHPDFRFDAFGIRETSRFSLAYNDWGLNLAASPQLGRGRDINGNCFKGVANDNQSHPEITWTINWASEGPIDR